MKPKYILATCIGLAAFLSFVLSVSIYFAAGDEITGRLNGIFVGVWVPSILALGGFLLSVRGGER